MQEMNYEGGYRDEPPVSPVYQGVPPPHYNTYNSGPVGQKLSGFVQSNVAGNGPSAGQRLVLAIVSLILWLGFFISIIFAFLSTVSRGMPMYTLFVLLLVCGLLVFTGLVVFINAVFNRNK